MISYFAPSILLYSLPEIKPNDSLPQVVSPPRGGSIEVSYTQIQSL